MKKIKNLVKKGGIADIVTLMIIVGLVIALIIAVVLPMIQQASDTGGEASANIGKTNSFITDLGKGGLPEAPTYVEKTKQP